jgi:hypothetical protein
MKHVATTTPESSAIHRAPPGGNRILQRRCSSSGSMAAAGPGGCDTCRKKKQRALQTKIRIGPEGDSFEREADRVAERILTSGSAPAAKAPPGIQRMTAGNAGTETAPASVEAALSAPGQALPEAERGFFESRFGHDFSGVRIHVDDRATAAVNAHAFTSGRDIVFASGQYSPATSAGRKLLAHELTHVVQQGQAERGPAYLQRQPGPPARRGRILSLAEISADAKREKARKLSGQTTAKVCRSIAAGAEKSNCPTALEPGTQVNIVATKAGGAWLQVVTAEAVPGFGPKEPLYVVAAFVEELAAPAVGPPVATEPEKDEPTTQDEDKQRAAEADRVKAGQSDIDAALVSARAGKQQADSLLADADQVDLDLLDIVHAQAEAVTETIALLEELGPVFAGLSDEHRKTILGLAYLEMQMYAQNAQHAYVLNRNVKLDIPDDVTNLDDVEEQLDEFAEWHEDWMTQNSYVGDLAGDMFALVGGLEDTVNMNLVAARELIDYEKNLKEEGETLKKIDDEMASFEKQTNWMRTKKKVASVAEFIISLRGRGKLKRPTRGKPGRTAKAPKPKRAKPAKSRKTFRKTKGQTKPKKAKTRKKKDKKKQRKGIYPICWPTLLGPPLVGNVPQLVFVRTPGADRDETAAQQMRMQRLWGKDPVANTMHLHHVVPLFLGGKDADQSNLTLIPRKNHLTGHSWLAHQPQMLKPPSGLKPMPASLYDAGHTAGTMYRLKGFKSSRTETC